MMALKKTAFEMQELFVKHLKQTVSANVSLADDLADLLNISNDSAYRRLRNETELSLDETYKICKHYKISIDSVFSSKGDSVSFNYIKLTDSSVNFESYLTGLLNQLKRVQKTENARLTYAAQEVPIFHSFYSPKLSAFKLFYWQRSVLNVSEYQHEKFSQERIPIHLIKLAAEISETYAHIKSQEIWTTDTIQTNIKQIEYYFESGAFETKEDALDILTELRQMVSYVHASAEKENKSTNTHLNDKSFQLYNSDVVIGTNCIYADLNGHSLSYISFNSMNSLTTANQEFCEEIDHWMKNLIKKSTLISGSAEKQRFQFFNKAYNAIDLSMERMKNL